VVAHKAIQVYYAPHPIITRNNADWWFIIKTKARGMIEDQQVDDFAYQEDFPYQNSGGISVDIDLPTTLLDSEGRFDEVSESDDDDHGLINDNVIVDNNIDDNEEYAEEEMMDNESDEDEGFSDQSNNEVL
jgi:hypothetical protein